MSFKSLYFSLFILVFVSLIACQKENNDIVKPTINILEPQVGDTLYLDSVSNFTGEFWDDKGLSSYFIQISDPNISNDQRIILNSDTIELVGDSLIYIDEIIQRTNIFNIKDTIVTVKNAFILDTIGYYNSRGPFPVKRGNYQFKVVVMDKAGNRDSSMFTIYIASPLSNK